MLTSNREERVVPIMSLTKPIPAQMTVYRPLRTTHSRLDKLHTRPPR